MIVQSIVSITIAVTILMLSQPALRRLLHACLNVYGKGTMIIALLVSACMAFVDWHAHCWQIALALTRS